MPNRKSFSKIEREEYACIFKQIFENYYIKMVKRKHFKGKKEKKHRE